MLGKILTSLHLLAVLRHVVWPDGTKELDVIVTVIFGHLFPAGFVRSLLTDTQEHQTRYFKLFSAHQTCRITFPSLT